MTAEGMIRLGWESDAVAHVTLDRPERRAAPAALHRAVRGASSPSRSPAWAAGCC